MARDPDLSARHDGQSLLIWLRWFVRARWICPVFLVAGSWAVARFLGVPFDLRAIIAIVLVTLASNAVTALSLRRDSIGAQRGTLELITSGVTIVDTLCLVAGVHYAGGANGPFWPFPFIPVILGAALLPSVRALVFHSAIALVATAVSAHPSGVHAVIATLLLSMMFISFGGLLVFGLARGARRQRSVARELHRALNDHQLAEAVARRREEILSVVSHELASPLMTLRGYVRLMQESKGSSRNGQLLERIDRQVARITSLADDLLEMASTSAGAMRLKRRHFDLVEALRELRENLRVQHTDANIELTGEQALGGVWDRNRLDQLFSNLVLNAIKFAGPRSRIVIDVRVESAREVHVRVTDNGPGISAEALPRVFEPFQRYSSERGGLGLGLAIAKAVTELHAGRIWAESVDKNGATIHVVLPTDAKPSGQLPVVDSDQELAVRA